jgi:selenocysteine-specific translation elongation factor
MDGHTIGVFGTDKEQKARFMANVAKKSEVEGMIVYHRNEAGKRYSFLDDPAYPERVQGYSRIASICDYAYYLLPKGGKLSAPDGELAVLLESYGLPGAVEIIDGAAPPDATKSAFKGLRLADYPTDERSGDSSIIDLSRIGPSPNTPPSGALVYIDRAFSVKGVGTVVLGFILGGKVSVHDKRCAFVLREDCGGEGYPGQRRGLRERGRRNQGGTLAQGRRREGPRQGLLARRRVVQTD